MYNKTDKITKNRGIEYKHFFVLALTILVFFSLSLFVYKINIAPQIHTHRVSLDYGFPSIKNSDYVNPIYNTVGNLKQSDRLEQSFVYSEDMISDFSVRFSESEKKNKGEIEVSFINKSANKVEFSKILDMGDIPKGNVIFKLEQPLYEVKNQTFAIIVDVLESDAGNEFSIMMFNPGSGSVRYNTENDKDILSLNGEKLDFKMAFQVMSGENLFIKPLYLAFIFIISLLIILIYYLVFIKSLKIETLFLIVAGIIGLIYLLSYPPFASMDGKSHICSAYRYANLFFGLGFGGENSALIRSGDFGVVPLYVTPTLSTYNYMAKNLFSLCGDNSLMQAVFPPAVGNGFSYIFSALGMSLARLLNLGFLPMLLMGGLFNFVFYAGCVYFTIKRIPFGKMVVFSVALLPMAMHIATSCSRDAIINAAAFLFVGTVIYMAYGKNAIKWYDVLILCLSGGLLVSLKSGVYVALLLLYFIIPIKRFKSKKLYLISTGCVIISCLVFFALCSFSDILSVAANPVSVAGHGTLSDIFHYPKIFIRMAYNTLNVQSYYYFCGMLVDSLHWIWAATPWYMFIGFLLILLLSSLKEKTEDYSVNSKIKGLFIAVFVITFCILISVAYTWGLAGNSVDPKAIIDGIQGRYFLPILPLLLLLVRSNNLTFESNINKGLIYSIFVMQVFTVLFAIGHLFSDNLLVIY